MGVVAGPAGQSDPLTVRVFKVTVAAFAASVNKTGVFELCNEFSYLGWHRSKLILLSRTRLLVYAT